MTFFVSILMRAQKNYYIKSLNLSVSLYEVNHLGNSCDCPGENIKEEERLNCSNPLKNSVYPENAE